MEAAQAEKVEEPMSRMTDEELFASFEKDRALASKLTDVELAQYLLDHIIGAVLAAQQEFGGGEGADMEIGAVREAAYRLGRLRELEPKEG
jgi:hypothetical protein